MRLTTFLARPRLSLGLALLLLPALAAGQESEAHNASLTGIGAVEVVVEAMDPGAEQDGLTRHLVQTDVEARLRQAGIPVGSNLTGHLYVNVDTAKGNDGQTYAYNVEIAYVQQVFLPRAPKTLLFAPTWETGGVCLIATARLREVRQDVANYVDQFIKAYREQNPTP